MGYWYLVVVKQTERAESNIEPQVSGRQRDWIRPETAKEFLPRPGRPAAGGWLVTVHRVAGRLVRITVVTAVASASRFGSRVTGRQRRARRTRRRPCPAAP